MTLTRPIPSPAQVEQWKRDAKRTKCRLHIAHSVALDEIARERGWPTWPALMRAFNTAQREIAETIKAA